MQPVNKGKPVDVDFNNVEEDGAVRLHLPTTQRSLRKIGIILSDGMRLVVSDGEIEEVGIVTFRDGIWVLIPDKQVSF